MYNVSVFFSLRHFSHFFAETFLIMVTETFQLFVSQLC